ncbi:hypothetical protein BDN70DRAFT_878710 [Pholiota conissans]|uniref:Uncharacterized protein n=1 Tax=Pholiota conissans TaxID=109636 RepID=A0A9P5Z187_9AGAR|nr:hypothetical protein BDN70DRAFT_878710 [Pholiota conissans]
MSATQAYPNLPPAKPNHNHTHKPDTPVAQFFWRWRMWFESTFVLSMLEPWEKILLLTIFVFFAMLVSVAVLKYLPHHLVFLRRRAMYYLWGPGDLTSAAAGVGGLTGSGMRVEL